MSANPNSVSGEFHDSIKPTRQNHQGKSMSPNTRRSAPTPATTRTPNSTPKSWTPVPHLHPRPTSPTPHPRFQDNPTPTPQRRHRTYPDATLNGSTSQEIYNMPNMGKPLQGQTHADKPKHGQHGYGFQGRPVEGGELSEKETMGFNEDPNRQKAGKTEDRVGKGTFKSESLQDVESREAQGIKTIGGVYVDVSDGK